MSLVSGRAIGIGAYLVRLSQRVIQVDNSAIILTGLYLLLLLFVIIFFNFILF